ncbi:MAG: glycoside hydrolase family 13 protein, partial [Acutalibacteraceae bacterium]
DRYICSDWSKQPEYRQTGDKCSLGNDYYGGDLKGIEEKLPYLEELGVTCIYLNPIFEAHSNHRYNTADYMKIDPTLGTEEDLVSLINEARRHGISIVLDGVFSHTGDDSRYFNLKHRYNTVGAANSPDSPYHSWYKFGNYPTGYSCWWGVPSLPETEEEDLSFSNFIAGENGVIRYWLKRGIKGWRLDVADELPDSFLDKIRSAVKAEGKDNYLLGEVWEDATNKISYGSRRRFLRGRQLDSVMNYPLSEAIITFVKGGNARDLADTVLDLLENYPPQAAKLLMNHIGTHDTARILTRLAKNGETGDREWQSRQTLSDEEYSHGVKLLKLAAVLQYTMPGVPSLYYGDEAGMSGFGDPFCRAGFPWGSENKELTEFYKALGQFRKKSPVFKSGEFIPVHADTGNIVYLRKKGKREVLVAVNRGGEPSEIQIPEKFNTAKIIFGHKPINGVLNLNKEDFAVLEL